MNQVVPAASVRSDKGKPACGVFSALQRLSMETRPTFSSASPPHPDGIFSSSPLGNPRQSWMAGKADGTGRTEPKSMAVSGRANGMCVKPSDTSAAMAWARDASEPCWGASQVGLWPQPGWLSSVRFWNFGETTGKNKGSSGPRSCSGQSEGPQGGGLQGVLVWAGCRARTARARAQPRAGAAANQRARVAPALASPPRQRLCELATA
ncbi:uncharacterized protein JN550_005484 [Neoarthrinium moseri]|uniref:uncharacterized protein n=1 Tax=Neoarthrinium moseri TaxID=1658444 RepID=UPI001FDBCC3E|nr:uncharacterized protein JN550_005484 [Neoarthrinium moseri]KAI1869894.1 hypothetical protein JN550_005484 [Neoarthrinium moseri]